MNAISQNQLTHLSFQHRCSAVQIVSINHTDRRHVVLSVQPQSNGVMTAGSCAFATRSSPHAVASNNIAVMKTSMSLRLTKILTKTRRSEPHQPTSKTPQKLKSTEYHADLISMKCCIANFSFHDLSSFVSSMGTSENKPKEG